MTVYKTILQLDQIANDTQLRVKDNIVLVKKIQVALNQAHWSKNHQVGVGDYRISNARRWEIDLTYSPSEILDSILKNWDQVYNKRITYEKIAFCISCSSK